MGMNGNKLLSGAHLKDPSTFLGSLKEDSLGKEVINKQLSMQPTTYMTTSDWIREQRLSYSNVVS